MKINQKTSCPEVKREGVKLQTNTLLLSTVLLPDNFNVKLKWVVLSAKDPGAIDRSSGNVQPDDRSCLWAQLQLR